MSEELEKKWRGEFEIYCITRHASFDLNKNSNGNYRSSISSRAWKAYFAACKKRQEENPNYYATMQEKLTKRDELLKEAIEEFPSMTFGGYKFNQWIQKAKEQLEQEK